MTRKAIFHLLAFCTSSVSAAEFLGTPRCGDCWCITEDDTCPTDTTGISDTFTATDELYATFELTKDPAFLKLQDANGADCYPFKDSVGAVDRYDESNKEQCVVPDKSDGAVCAYVYDSSSTTCEGRKYSIQNFASGNDAMGSNAHIVHEGACGVCSSAQDFGARIKTYGSLETESIVCATSYTFSRDFPSLVQCYAKLGFTESCATLWAHFAATNGSKCAFNCIPGSSGITELNGPAPECAPSSCLECQVGFRGVFDDLAGIQFAKAGITERIAQKCDNFYRIIHDPCIGLGSGGNGDVIPDSTPGSPPVETPEESSTEESSPEESSSIRKTIEIANLLAMAMSLLLLVVVE